MADATEIFFKSVPVQKYPVKLQKQEKKEIPSTRYI